MQRIYNLMPGIDCSACFVPYCTSLARRAILGLNDLEECPLLMSGKGRSESLPPLKEEMSSGQRPGRDRVSILGTTYTLEFREKVGVKGLDLVDVSRAKELFEAFIGTERVRLLPKVGILRVRIEDRIFTIARDGRIVHSGKGPPDSSILDNLARVLWGSVNR